MPDDSMNQRKIKAFYSLLPKEIKQLYGISVTSQ